MAGDVQDLREHILIFVCCGTADCTQALSKVEVRILYIRADEGHLNSRQF